MKLTFNPFTQLLEKAKKLPDGTRRQYGKFWFKKQGDKWIYDGMATGKSVMSTSTTTTQTPQVTPTNPPPQPSQSDLMPMTQTDFDGLKVYHTKRNRMTEGQQVTYIGTYWRGRQGQKGTLIAIGDRGFAMVKFSDGKTETAAWKDLQPVGQINPYSLYDKIDSMNVYRISGEVQNRLKEVVNQKIGTSNMSYLDLCREVQKRGFNLQIVGGTVRDILAKKKEIKDIDFVFSGNDRELYATVQNINPKWLANSIKNSHLGLCSFSDGGDVVDITPVHKFSHELNDMAKGWNLYDDASARDLAMNTLQVDPLNGILTDATGKGLKDILDNTIHFSDVRALKVTPVYTLRAFKFMMRGYNSTPETDAAIKDNLRYTANLSPHRKERFMRRQIGEKDGIKGLDGFKEAFKKYDSGLWDRSFEQIWRGVYRSFGGK